jgi:hypothetical protein
MSAAGRGSARIVEDQYFSPRWTVHRLLEAYELPAGIWLEPCAGAGSIIRAVSEVRTDVTWSANEPDERYSPSLHALSSVYSVTSTDARSLFVPRSVKVIKTNPPFGLSLEILETMLRASWALPVFLQRINWAVGPRADLLREIKPSVYVLPDRPSFCDMYDEEAPEELRAQTDATEYAWFCFDGRGEFRILGDTPMHIRRTEIEEGRADGTRPKKASKARSREAA